MSVKKDLFAAKALNGDLVDLRFKLGFAFTSHLSSLCLSFSFCEAVLRCSSAAQSAESLCWGQTRTFA